MVMPERNGSEVYARMKEAHPDVKVILASGYSMNGTMRGLLDEGVLDFIQKPFDPGEMARKVGAALQAGR